jgi:hypothetical protein
VVRLAARRTPCRTHLGRGTGLAGPARRGKNRPAHRVGGAAGCLVFATAQVPRSTRAVTTGHSVPQPGYRTALADRGSLLSALLNVLCTCTSHGSDPRACGLRVRTVSAGALAAGCAVRDGVLGARHRGDVVYWSIQGCRRFRSSPYRGRCGRSAVSRSQLLQDRRRASSASVNRGGAARCRGSGLRTARRRLPTGLGAPGPCRPYTALLQSAWGCGQRGQSHTRLITPHYHPAPSVAGAGRDRRPDRHRESGGPSLTGSPSRGYRHQRTVTAHWNPGLDGA